jgi:hypothetical protein
MFSSASGWNRGKQIWRVLHDCEKGRYHLEITGTALAALADIRKRLTEAQNADGGEKADGDHIYDIPAELARTLTDFRHDQDIPSKVHWHIASGFAYGFRLDNLSSTTSLKGPQRVDMP